MTNAVYHLIILVEAIIIVYIFLTGYSKTKNKNLLWLSVAFLAFFLGYLIHFMNHFIEDYIGFEPWILENVEHISLVIVLTVMIWAIWPKSKWRQELKQNHLR